MVDDMFNDNLSYITRLCLDIHFILFFNLHVMPEYTCYTNITHVLLCTCVPDAFRGQEGALNPLELEL